MTYRNRPYLNLLRELPCMLQLSCEGQIVACHSNLLRHGRGVGHKSHDCFAVAGCTNCHSWLDTSGAPREEKEQMFMAALERQWLFLFQHNLIKINDENKKEH